MKDDKEIITSIASGNEDSFSIVYDKHYNMVKNNVMNKLMKNKNEDEAKFLVDHAIEKLFVKIKNDHKKVLKNIITRNSLHNFLYTIAKNKFIDNYRRSGLCVLESEAENEGKNRFSEEDDKEMNVLDISDNEEEGALNSLIRNNEHRRLRSAVMSLKNEKIKNVIIMRFFEEKDYKEISENMDIPIGTVKTMIYRGKKMLRKIIKE